MLYRCTRRYAGDLWIIIKRSGNYILKNTLVNTKGVSSDDTLAFPNVLGVT